MLVLVVSALSLTSRSVGAQSQKATKTSLKAGQTFKDCRNCPEMVAVSAADTRAQLPHDSRREDTGVNA
jgi:hypothetical protein